MYIFGISRKIIKGWKKRKKFSFLFLFFFNSWWPTKRVFRMRDSDCAGLHYKTGRGAAAGAAHERHGMMADRWVGFSLPFLWLTGTFFFSSSSLLAYCYQKNFFIHHHHHPFNLTYFPHMWARAARWIRCDRWERKALLSNGYWNGV